MMCIVTLMQCTPYLTVYNTCIHMVQHKFEQFPKNTKQSRNRDSEINVHGTNSTTTNQGSQHTQTRTYIFVLVRSLNECTDKRRNTAVGKRFLPTHSLKKNIINIYVDYNFVSIC